MGGLEWRQGVHSNSSSATLFRGLIRASEAAGNFEASERSLDGTLHLVVVTLLQGRRQCDWRGLAAKRTIGANSIP